MKLTDIHHKLSTSYHPQTDRSSEQMNKTMIQCLWFHVECNQKSWVKALLKVWFNIMNNINVSTSFSPFMLKTGQSHQLLPPIISTSQPSDGTIDNISAHKFMDKMEEQTKVVKDCPLSAKLRQVHKVNKNRIADLAYKVGDQVLLAMVHQ